MKILFIGDFKSNAGPANVNKQMAKCFDGQYLRINSKNTILKFIELVIKLWICRVVVLSAITRVGMVALNLARFFGTKTVYLMHGSIAYETILNGSGAGSHEMELREKKLLEKADLILPVSEAFSRWVKERYPEYAGKTAHLYNGMELKKPGRTGSGPRDKGSVFAVGGDRGTKNNAVVSKAIERMNGAAHLTVCGRLYDPEFVNRSNHSTYLGLISQEEFNQKLRRAQLFVLNSLFEPFSLSVADALACGCSILVSQYAGIADLLNLTEQDIIFDPMNEEEIRGKIYYLLENSNNERILSHLDGSRLSYEARVSELTALCRSLVKNRM